MGDRAERRRREADEATPRAKRTPDADSMPDHALLALQRAAGNQATVSMLAGGGDTVQRMLAYGKGDIRSYFPPSKKGGDKDDDRDDDDRKDKQPGKDSKPSLDGLVIDGDEHDYTATINGRVVASLTLYEDDDGNFWINNIATDDAYQRLGIATQLIDAAIADHGTIYASQQRADQDDDTDTRHLEPDGYQLVMGIIGKGRNIVYAMPPEHDDFNERDDFDDDVDDEY